MKMWVKMMATGAALVVGTAGHATVLTFDSLQTTYGDGSPYADGTSGDGQYLSYTEGGYVLTLNTTNAPNSFYGAHIGDAGSTSTFNWHDDGDNLIGAYVTLTRAGGGAFDLASFDYSSRFGLGLTVAGGNGAAQSLGQNTSGTYLAGFSNVTSVTFRSDGVNNNQLDNIVLTASAVPEPATWAMMIGGIGVAGGAMRRRRRVSTSVRFA